MAKQRDYLLDYWINNGIDFVNRRIHLDTDIDDVSVNLAIRALFSMIQKSVSLPITLIINSGGGEVYSALALIDFIKDHKDIIHTHGNGKIMSCAVDIFLAGGRRTCTDYCTFMMHAGSSGMAGKYYEMAPEIKELKRLDDLALSYYSQETGKSILFWKNKLKQGEFYFNKTTALELGIINDV